MDVLIILMTYIFIAETDLDWWFRLWTATAWPTQLYLSSGIPLALERWAVYLYYWSSMLLFCEHKAHCVILICGTRTCGRNTNMRIIASRMSSTPLFTRLPILHAPRTASRWVDGPMTSRSRRPGPGWADCAISVHYTFRIHTFRILSCLFPVDCIYQLVLMPLSTCLYILVPQPHRILEALMIHYGHCIWFNVFLDVFSSLQIGAIDSLHILFAFQVALHYLELSVIDH